MANQTCTAAVWTGPLAVDGPVDASSASGLAVHAAWISLFAVLARWFVKVVETIEETAAAALETVSSAAQDLRAVAGAVRRDVGAAFQVLTDQATTGAALLLERAGTVARTLLVLGAVAAMWAISHRAWNKYIHALRGNTTPDASADRQVPELSSAPAEPPPPRALPDAERLARQRTAAAQTAEVHRKMQAASPPARGRPAPPRVFGNPDSRWIQGLIMGDIIERSPSWDAGVELFRSRWDLVDSRHLVVHKKA